MKREDEPISDDEWLVRLVWEDRFDPVGIPIISPKSFLPRKDEVGGISFFRRACLLDPVDALNVIQEEKQVRYAVVLVSVASIRALGFTVEADPIDATLGHVVVPEININSYKSDKNRFAENFLRLAFEASANILRRPLV